MGYPLAQSEDHETLDLGVVSLSSMWAESLPKTTNKHELNVYSERGLTSLLVFLQRKGNAMIAETDSIWKIQTLQKYLHRTQNLILRELNGPSGCSPPSDTRLINLQNCKPSVKVVV